MVTQSEKDHLVQIEKAFRNGHMGIMECKSKETGQRVVVLTALNMDGKSIETVPMAAFFTESPYKTLECEEVPVVYQARSPIKAGFTRN